MLISQSIAKNANFLKAVKGGYQTADEVRATVIQSVKFIVGTDLFSYELSTVEIRKKITGDNSADRFEKKVEQFKKFARLPFDKMFIENNTGALLVQVNDKGNWVLTDILTDGSVSPITIELPPVETSDGKGFDTVFHLPPPLKKKWEEEGNDKLSAYNGFVTILMLCEILLFLNISNVNIHHYIPTRKENEMMAKTLQTKFTYRVLDVYREKKQYVSLLDIFDHLFIDKEETVKRRAHLVRGHFKQKNGRLFWWNSFLRCRTNKEVVGMVDKDYRLNDTGPV
jgi:hypothetical protein